MDPISEFMIIKFNFPGTTIFVLEVFYYGIKLDGMGVPILPLIYTGENGSPSR